MTRWRIQKEAPIASAAPVDKSIQRLFVDGDFGADNVLLMDVSIFK
jgi:hypothetical protein